MIEFDLLGNLAMSPTETSSQPWRRNGGPNYPVIRSVSLPEGEVVAWWLIKP